LLGSVEFAFSGWGRPEEVPVFGFDLSAPLFRDLSFRDEGTLSRGFPADKMRADGRTFKAHPAVACRFLNTSLEGSDPPARSGLERRSGAREDETETPGQQGPC
jgi:hypothetical protein